MKRGNRTLWLSVLGGVLGAVAIYFGCTVPICLSVDIKPKTIYAGDLLDSDDFSVRTKTLFGFSETVSNFEVFAKNGNENVSIQWEHLRKSMDVNPVKAKDIKVEYQKPMYVGQIPDVQSLEVTATYENKKVKPVESIWIDPVVVPNVNGEYSFWVHTGMKDVRCPSQQVVAPDSMSASYLGDAVVGEKFYWEKVNVQLHYPDDTTFRTNEFVVNHQDDKVYMDLKDDLTQLSYPKYLSEEMDLFAITPYGTTKFHIAPKQENTLVAQYNGTIYEGDMLQKEKVSVMMHTDAYGDVAVSEYRFDNPGCVTTDMTIRIPTRFGVVPLVIQPVKVQSVFPILPNDIQENDKAVLNGIRMVYEDGKEFELDVSDVQFLNLPKKWKQKQTVWFIWHQNQYSMNVEVVSKEVLQHRGVEKGIKYDISDKTAQMLTLICQRLGDKDMDLNANELALMLNRYELYGNGPEGSSDDLLNYVLDSGYWGSRDSILSIIENSKPNENVLQMVKDTLANGYRTLPSYVDERVSSAVFSIYTDVILQKDMLIPQDTIDVNVYLYTTDDSSGYLYGYSENAYEKTYGRKPTGIQIEEDTLPMNGADDEIQITVPEG